MILAKPSWKGAYLPFGSGPVRFGPAIVKGMGAAGDIISGSLVDTGFGTKVDCSRYMGWLSTPTCWQASPSAWQAIADGQYSVPPGPVVVTAPTTAQAAAAANDPALAAALIQTQIDNGQLATDAQNQGFFADLYATLQGSGNPPASSAIPSWFWWAVGLGGGLLVFQAVKR